MGETVSAPAAHNHRSSTGDLHVELARRPTDRVFLAEQRHQSPLAEVEHDRLLKQVMNSPADTRPARNRQNRLSLQFIVALMFATVRPEAGAKLLIHSHDLASVLRKAKPPTYFFPVWKPRVLKYTLHAIRS
ncbi:MAG TPA: hypothetical protein VKQ30_11020 [Ktedonobacterales bacterium]|nr:hypothetical protein [Ktedonobacterales bacterium]